MNCKTLIAAVAADTNNCDNRQGIAARLFATGGMQDTFIVKTMKDIVNNTYVAQKSWHDHTPICSRCRAALVQTVKVKVKNGRTKTTTKKFKNQQEAMLLGKHKHSCAFVMALSIVLDHE